MLQEFLELLLWLKVLRRQQVPASAPLGLPARFDQRLAFISVIVLLSMSRVFPERDLVRILVIILVRAARTVQEFFGDLLRRLSERF